MTPAQFSFFRRCLRERAESLLQDEVIDSAQCNALQSFPNTERGKSCASTLFSRRVVIIPDHHLRFQLKALRETDGGNFDFIEILLTAEQPVRRNRNCFVGHRFVPSVTKTLRWNLRQILEPYNVHLDWSGKDIRSVAIFDDIVARIKKADFCIFDNRATLGRPNVYIEAGIAYALKTPFILFDNSPKGTTSIPSDLSHCLAIRYTSYQKLFREFYGRLPVFFQRNFGDRR
jgi:hypothetical protein